MTTSAYTRRTALMTVGIAAATALTGCASGACCHHTNNRGRGSQPLKL